MKPHFLYKLRFLVVLLFLVAGVLFWQFSDRGKGDIAGIETQSTQLSEASRLSASIALPKSEPPSVDTPSAKDQTTDKISQNLDTQVDVLRKKILDIPFYSQAPFSIWDKVHEEMCEEASLLNAGLYLLGEKLSLEKYEAELLRMKGIEEAKFGKWESTTVAETKQLADTYFKGKLEIKIIDDPTVEQIERAISLGHPVVAPLSGRDLGNPNFTPPGPVYHMLVIRGYDEKFFYTNDVGTRKGDLYKYPKEVIMENLHDYNEQDIHLGKSKILILSK